MENILAEIDEIESYPLIDLSSGSDSDYEGTSTSNSNHPGTSCQVSSTLVGFGSVPKPQDPGSEKIKKLLSDLQFSNPGDQNKVGLALPPRRRGRPPKYTKNLPGENPRKNRIRHDKDGNLVVDDKKYQQCDCLRLDCNGCQWPCEKCGGTLCNPLHCQKNRNKLLLKVEDNGDPDSVRINPHLADLLPKTL